jgi:hypothetical protein
MQVAERVPLEAIESSNLAAVGYNPEKKILAVQFKSGAIFHYSDVSLETAQEFYGSESRGRYYAQHIRGKITGRLMTGTCQKCGDEHGWIGEKCTECGTDVYVEPPRKERS